jgi:inorganic pyrophosphatase
VNAVEPRLNHIQELKDVPFEKQNEIKYFFSHYKDLENKKVEVGNFEGKEQAEKLLKDCQASYQKEIKKAN